MKKASQGYIIGRHVFAKISAVEGVHLTREMHKDFSSFEREGLSPKGRRLAIVRKYGR